MMVFLFVWRFAVCDVVVLRLGLVLWFCAVLFVLDLGLGGT